jgi:hypothetical protein
MWNTWARSSEDDFDADDGQDGEMELACCGNCSGSGEGMYDGATCGVCRGRGEVLVPVEAEPAADEEEEAAECAS